MNLAFPLQRVHLQVRVTPAQYTVLFFMTGRRFDDLETIVTIDGRTFDEALCHVEYLYPGHKSPAAAVRHIVGAD